MRGKVTSDPRVGGAQLLGAETCPGVKRGGYLNLIRRKIRCSCPGDVVPAYVEVDVSTLELNQRVLLSDISFPPGVVVSVKVLPWTSCGVVQTLCCSLMALWFCGYMAYYSVLGYAGDGDACLQGSGEVTERLNVATAALLSSCQSMHPGNVESFGFLRQLARPLVSVG